MELSLRTINSSCDESFLPKQSSSSSNNNVDYSPPQQQGEGSFGSKQGSDSSCFCCPVAGWFDVPGGTVRPAQEDHLWSWPWSCAKAPAGDDVCVHQQGADCPSVPDGDKDDEQRYTVPSNHLDVHLRPRGLPGSSHRRVQHVWVPVHPH